MAFKIILGIILGGLVLYQVIDLVKTIYNKGKSKKVESKQNENNKEL